MKAVHEKHYRSALYWGADGYWEINVWFARNVWPYGRFFDNTSGIFREDYITESDGGFWGGVIA